MSRFSVLTGPLVALFLAAMAAAQAPCGDCNGDGSTTILDALVAAQDAAGLVSVPMASFAQCDVDTSGFIDVLDALGIAQEAAGLGTGLSCAPSRTITAILPVQSLTARPAYSEQVSLALGGHPLVLVRAGESQSLVLEAQASTAPSPVDVAMAVNAEGSTTYSVTGTAVGVDANGILTAGSANGCALVEATFTPNGITTFGAPVHCRFAACVNLGGPDDDPPGDRFSLGLGDVDLTLPGMPDGPIVPAMGGSMDVFLDIQAGTSTLGSYQLALQWSPSSPTLVLDPTFGAASGTNFGVDNRDPATGQLLSPLTFGPFANSDNLAGTTVFLDLNTTTGPTPTGVVRVAVLRFVSQSGGATTASIGGTIEVVSDLGGNSIGPPTPRPLTTGAGSFELP